MYTVTQSAAFSNISGALLQVYGVWRLTQLILDSRAALTSQ